MWSERKRGKARSFSQQEGASVADRGCRGRVRVSIIPRSQPSLSQHLESHLALPALYSSFSLSLVPSLELFSPRDPSASLLTVRLVIFLCARDVSGTLVATLPRATAVPGSTTRTNIKPETAIRRPEYGSSPRTSPYAGDACVAFKPTPKPSPYPPAAVFLPCCGTESALLLALAPLSLSIV